MEAHYVPGPHRFVVMETGFILKTVRDEFVQRVLKHSDQTPEQRGRRLGLKGLGFHGFIVRMTRATLF